MRRTFQIAVVLISLSAGVALSSETSVKAPVQSTTAERFKLAPGGVIRFEHSVGYLTVEGWDRPEVEITITKSTDAYYAAGANSDAESRLNRVRVAVEHRSDAEVFISTWLNHRLLAVSPLKTRGGIAVEYRVRAPHDARLVVHQNSGYVLLSGLIGPIEATNHSGDVMLMLPRPGPYSIDAKSRFGGVYSDFGESGHRWYLLGERFARQSLISVSPKIYLRVRRGAINIKQLPAESR